MDIDRLRDALVQTISGEEGNFIHCKVQVNVLAVEPGYHWDYGVLA